MIGPHEQVGSDEKDDEAFHHPFHVEEQRDAPGHEYQGHGYNDPPHLLILDGLLYEVIEAL